MLRREVMRLGSLFGLGAGTPSRFPYQDRPQSGPGIGASSGQVIRATIVIISGIGGGLFVYSPAPGTGNLILSIAATPGTDPYGNPYVVGFASYDNSTGFLVTLNAAGLTWTTSSGHPLTLKYDPVTNAVLLAGAGGTALSINADGDLAVKTLSVVGGSTALGQLVFVKQTGTDNAMTIFLNVGSGGGAAQAALNVVSDNPNFSAAEVRGTETGRGTLKITHDGYADGSDANAAGLSIDMQTTQGGGTGTNARGIFITSTTDSPMGGDAIAVFVGVPVPVLRFQVNGSGNLVARANAFFTNPVIIGATASDAGGSGSGLTLCHTTDPTSNPAAGHSILFVDAAGNLKARGSAGTITTIAVP